MNTLLFVIILLFVTSKQQVTGQDVVNLRDKNTFNDETSTEDSLLIKLLVEILKINSQLKEKRIPETKNNFLASLFFYNKTFKHFLLFLF
jgi:hypothetical protein